MRDAQARCVQERVEGYLEGHRVDLGNPNHFQGLLAHVRLGCTGLAEDDLAEDDLRIVTAMCLLGPRFAGIPPAAMRDKLLDALRQFVPDEQKRLERVMEFAIAYGCGKWRIVQEGCEGWEQQWQGAVRGLVRALEPAVNQSYRWLHDCVVGFPQRSSEELWSDGSRLAMSLKHPVHPLHLEQEHGMNITCTNNGTELDVVGQGYSKTNPPGAKAVFTVAGSASVLKARRDDVPLGDDVPLEIGAKVTVIARDDETRITVALNNRTQRTRLQVRDSASIIGPVTLEMWECSCGNVHCAERHRLEAWDPTTQVNLWAFVASAVKGPQPNIQTGSFVQGMYFPLLSQEGF